MKQILRVTGQPPEGQRDVVRDLRTAVEEVLEVGGRRPDILHILLGEHYMLDVMHRISGSDWPERGSFSILGHPVYLDVDLAPGAFQVVWTR